MFSSPDLFDIGNHRKKLEFPQIIEKRKNKSNKNILLKNPLQIMKED
jgi:hypothetical protein